MWKPAVVKFFFFIIGVVVGGLVVFGIIKLTENSSSNGDSTSGSDSPGSRANSTLKYVIAVSRHGNKGGSYDYPLDPYPINSSEYWPYGSGQLTPHGRVQEYNLGVKLRSLYNGFLNSSFYTEDIYACTDLYERTMMSGELVLAGLFPPEGWQVWSQHVHWQPIPLYTNSTDHTKVMNSCPRYKEIEIISFEQFLKADAVNISALRSHVYIHTGKTLTAYQLATMWEKFSTEEAEGYTLPEWTRDIYPNYLSDYYGKSFIASCAATDEMVGLWVGDLLSEMLDSLEDVINGSLTRRKMSYYSAHDSSLLNLQVALGIPTSSVISLIHMGSALVLELHQDADSSQFYIQVLYIDGALLDSEPLSLSLPDCGDPCYFNVFLNSTQRYTRYSYEDGCQATDSSTPRTVSTSCTKEN